MSSHGVTHDVRNFLILAPQSLCDKNITEIMRHFSPSGKVKVFLSNGWSASDIAKAYFLPVTNIPHGTIREDLIVSRYWTISLRSDLSVESMRLGLSPIRLKDVEAVIAFNKPHYMVLGAAIARSRGIPMHVFEEVCHHQDNPPVLTRSEDIDRWYAKWEISAFYTANIFPLLRTALLKTKVRKIHDFASIGKMQDIQRYLCGHVGPGGDLDGLEKHLHPKAKDPGYCDRRQAWADTPELTRDQALKWMRTWSGRLRRYQAKRWKEEGLRLVDSM